MLIYIFLGFLQIFMIFFVAFRFPPNMVSKTPFLLQVAKTFRRNSCLRRLNLLTSSAESYPDFPEIFISDSSIKKNKNKKHLHELFSSSGYKDISI